MIKIFATYQNGERREITDFYWFEENGVHDLEGEGHHLERFKIEIYDGEMCIYPKDINNPAWILYDQILKCVKLCNEEVR
jgi:hypothetical protein